MKTAHAIKLEHTRHVCGTGVVKYDMDALVEHSRNECIAEFHHDDVGVSEYVFSDSSSLTVFHPVVDAMEEEIRPLGHEDQVGDHESVETVAKGRIGVLRSLVRFFKRGGAQS